MIEVAISSSRLYHINHLAVDFNGTLACDGILDHSTNSLLQTLSESVEIHVLTSDTFGTAEEQLKDISCKLVIVPDEHQAAYKGKIIQQLGARQTVAMGNGANDYLMLKTAIVGIGVIGSEGAAVLACNNADIICTNITDALELLIHPKRIKATLRS